MDPPVGPMDVNPESKERENPATTHPPQMCSAPRPFLCPQCPKTFRIQKNLDFHMKVHSPDNPHVCPLCNKVWANSYQLTVHLRSHTGERLFKCSAKRCGKEFARRHTLQFHNQAHHGKPKPTCAICAKSFASTGSLANHNSKFHNAEKKQHPCVTWGKVYVSLTELTRHLKTHITDDPSHSPITGTSFRNEPTRKEHVQKHGRDVREGQFHCEHCAKVFKTNKYLNSHIRTVHHGRKYIRSRNYVCSLCELKCVSPSLLVRHMRTHTGEKPFKCTTCPKAFSTAHKLGAHLKVHTGEKPEECQFCGRRFAWKRSLKRHIRTHTGETTYQCDKCGRAFGDPTTMKRHRLAIHPEQLREEDGQTPTNTQVDPLDIPPNKQGLNSNSSGNLDVKVGPADANPETQESETPAALHPPAIRTACEPRPFPCPHCPMTYRYQKHLNAHLNIHNMGSPHVCPLCDKVWADSFKLTRHMRGHTGEKLFKCSAQGCAKEFMRRETLEAHMQIHTGEKKPHPCVTCGKVFLVSSILKRHLETHLPDDPQSCATCGKSCRNGRALKEHVERHGQEGTYKCEQCAKNFKTKGHLKRHIRTHTGKKPFKCTTCSKAYTTKENLQNHIKFHAGEKPKECQFCGRRFTIPYSLFLHLRAHTGETPYKRGECGQAFAHSATLKTHVKEVHLGQQRREASTHVHTDGVVPTDPMTDTPSKNTKEIDAQVAMESSCELYLDKGFHLRELTIPVPRMRLQDVGGGVLELRSEGDCWYVCSKCGRGSKNILIRSHALQCQVHRSNNPINETGQTIL